MTDVGANVQKRVQGFRRSLFYYPAGSIGIAILLFMLTTWVDRNVQGVVRGFEPTLVGALVFAGSPEASRSILGAIATMWATITGVVYSVTLVTVQLSATKYTAEVIPRFEKDRTNRLVLALYTGTVAYSLLVLKTVRVEQPAFAPALGVNVAIILALLSLFFLGVFIANLTAYMRPKRFVDDLADAVEREMRALDKSMHVAGAKPLYESPARERDRERRIVRAPVSGYVTGAHVQQIADVARALPRGTVVRLHAPPGTRVREGDRVFDVDVPRGARPEPGNGAAGELDEALAQLAGALAIGPTRTLEGDPRLGVKTLQDIGFTTIHGATDAAVAVRSVEALMWLAHWEAGRERVPRGIEVDGVSVDLAHAPLFPDVLRRAKQVHDASVSKGLWALTEALIDESRTVLRQLGEGRDRARYREFLDFVESVLVDAFTGIRDDDALARTVRLLETAAQDMDEDDRPGFAVELRRMIVEAAAKARRVDEDALGARASRALEDVRAHV